MSPQDVKRKLEAGEIRLVDIREPDEVESLRIGDRFLYKRIRPCVRIGKFHIFNVTVFHFKYRKVGGAVVQSNRGKKRMSSDDKSDCPFSCHSHCTRIGNFLRSDLYAGYIHYFFMIKETIENLSFKLFYLTFIFWIEYRIDDCVFPTVRSDRGPLSVTVSRKFFLIIRIEFKTVIRRVFCLNVNSIFIRKLQ